MDLGVLDRPGDYIDGRFQVARAAESELVIASPADSADVTAIHPVARAQLLAALGAARAAFPAWRRLPRERRAEHLLRYCERLRVHREAIALVLAREVGKPLWEARTEVDAMIGKVAVTLGEGLSYTPERELPDLPGEIRQRPHGVIAVIGPFNFPGHLPNGQFLPALLLGNAVVHKPSERTPSAATWIARCFDEAGLPPGVFNVVQGPGELGALLGTHPEVDGVMFTGSVGVGRRLLASQRDRIDRIIALELGGKNAAVVLDDCELERSARSIAFSAYVTAGQRCSATSRVAVTRGIARAFLDRLAAITRGLRVGHPLEADVFMGPVISGEALDRLSDAQRRAAEHGYRVLVPGGPMRVAGRSGHYAAPGLRVADDGTLRAAGYTDSELFGPELAVHVVQNVDEAIAFANDTWSGLTAGVYTRSREAFERASDELKVGVLHWNRPTAGASARLPFGGVKDSGNHRPAGIMAGAACAYPLSITWPPDEKSALPSWPGSGLDP